MEEGRRTPAFLSLSHDQNRGMKKYQVGRGREKSQEFACHLGWSELEWERETENNGTGRSINQQIFIEQLPWLAAGESSAGGRHIRKLSMKRWLWGRVRDVFFWNRIERGGGWLLCGTAGGIVHCVASGKVPLGLCKATHAGPGEKNPTP